GLDRLERINLHRRIDRRVLANKAFVADHDILFDTRALAHVARTTDHCTAYARARTEIDVVVHDAAFELRVDFHDDVGAEHCVRPQHRTGFDARVVADDYWSVDVGVGRNVGPLSEPHAVAHFETRYVDVHL